MAKTSDIELLCRGVGAWNTQRKEKDFVPVLTHLDIRNADLRGVNLFGADFDGTRMTNVNLQNANLERARLNGVRITNTHFGNSNLAGVELKGADFTRVCLHNAILDKSIGLDFKVRHGDLTDVSVCDAKLEMTHLYNCDLTAADFRGSALPDTVFKRVVIDDLCRAEAEKTGARILYANEPHPNEWVDWDAFDVRCDDAEFGVIIYEGRAYWIAEGRWDFFISHASEDKNSVARPLAEALRALNQRVWFDELTIKAGDSLEDVIAQGTQASVFGIAVVSPRFFGRRWTEAELTALEQKRMFLVLHDMDAEDLAKLRPSLAKRLCLRSEIGSEALAQALLEAARHPGGNI
jgi:hypothetical protein